MTPMQWVMSSDTGISSKTIWAVFMGAVHTKNTTIDYDVPHDPSDFGRCYRLLKLFPEWHERLDEVSAKFPKWGPMVREWDKMTAIYERDLPTGKSNELYNLMQDLEREGKIADGWVRTGPGCWKKENAHSVSVGQ